MSLSYTSPGKIYLIKDKGKLTLAAIFSLTHNQGSCAIPKCSLTTSFDSEDKVYSKVHPLEDLNATQAAEGFARMLNTWPEYEHGKVENAGNPDDATEDFEGATYHAVVGGKDMEGSRAVTIMV